MDISPQAFWSIPSDEMLRRLRASPQGLTSAEAQARLARYGANLLKPRRRSDALALLVAQFKSPIIIILVIAASLSLFLRDQVDAVIILIIILASGLLSFWQERGATSAVAKLMALVEVTATVVRDGTPVDISVEQVVPGDIAILKAGDLVPGDCLVLDCKDLFVDEAALTGETYPEDKFPGVLPADSPLGERKNTLFLGTHVVSGSATALVVRTGKDTEFGKVSERLVLRPAETEFERGVRRFGYFLLEVTLVLVVAIFAFNVYLERPVLDSFLFSLALAVGLTPQLLPAIISVNLAHGARRMAQKRVIVKRLAAIENFGSMNVLCSDKTGTLTEGIVRIHSALDINGKESQKVFFHAYLNAFYETGFTNPIDEAIRSQRQVDLTGYQKLDEVPYDFVRKRLTILVAKDGKHFMITKGAVPNVLSACSLAETADGAVDIAAVRGQIEHDLEQFSSQGLRTLAVAYRDMDSRTTITKSDEADMTFLGFLTLFDPPKSGIAATVSQLRRLGVSLKVITGDNRLVAASLGEQVGIGSARVVTGQELHHMSDEALRMQANDVDIFAEVEPNQKERIILALKQSGNVVGYMGDGINDAPALHAADVGISVDSAVDVAKDAAEIVMLDKDLDVLVQGIREGRVTFANTLKYVFMATSANFGNMFSMAGASLFLDFLPLLPKQVLLTNLLTDLPEMTIATDSVDDELVERPRRWDIRFIRNFMMTFGLVSSLFDYLTFGALLLILDANTAQFRTGWFWESVISAATIVMVIRTRRLFFRSTPSKYLLLTTIAVAAVTLALPVTPLAEVMGFKRPPLLFLPVLGAILALYVIAAEAAKRLFYMRVNL